MTVRALAIFVRLLALVGLAVSAAAQPVSAAFPGPARADAVAAAALSGVRAVSDLASDQVRVYDDLGTLLRTITRTQIAALCPWMTLDAGPDGPHALAFSDSGRLLFVMVRDGAAAGDGQPSDAVLRLDTITGQLTRFARYDLAPGESPAGAALHFRGVLYLGLPGQLQAYNAGAALTAGTFSFARTMTPGVDITGLALDREQGTLFVATSNFIERLTISDASLINQTRVGSISGLGSITFSTHYGGTATPGLFAFRAGATPQVARLTLAQARGAAVVTPPDYAALPADASQLAATTEGTLLIGRVGGADEIRDLSDTRVPPAAFAANEFAQVVNFAKSLVTVGVNSGPAGTRGVPGWVIDADVQIGWSRFHPVTPDAAAWTVLLLIASDHVNRAGGGAGDPQALPLVRQILTRYAGLAADGIGPVRSADGLYQHWLDPATGATKSGWPVEYATMSTMKIVLAAARARAYWDGDGEIGRAARAIICGVTNWENSISPAGQLYLTGPAGGGLGANPSGPFNEGALFVEQAQVYGGTKGDSAWTKWLNRATLPSAAYVPGFSVSGDSGGQFLPAFASQYSLLTQSTFRTLGTWRGHFLNLRLSHAAWTDDTGPRWNTVFSAGTTKSAWGGYHADSLTDHPGDVAHFPSLMALSAESWAPERHAAVAAAYHAYRTGARQAFLGGASILYRRSSVDPAYQPDSAGMPDVALGGLALADVLRPGTLDAVITGAYPSCGECPGDLNFDGFVDDADFVIFSDQYDRFACGATGMLSGCPADLNADGFVDDADFVGFAERYDVFVCP